jgi:Holliday junction resolvasome RuvABC ATP-dependent DNA helicase subunit
MKFIGQFPIMNQLQFILPDLYENRSRSANILIRGPSGYGKTTMALGICRYLSGDSFETYMADSYEYRLRKRVIFIDEVHRNRDFESLYPYMDSGKFVFIFATNQDGNLPEAFSNRCFEFVFTKYSEDELILIARESSEFRTSDSSFLEIVMAGNSNPRIIKSLCSRLSTYFRINNIQNTYNIDYKELISKIFNIEDGLDTLCKRYLEVLHNVGGRASIGLLKSLLHVDESTLKNTVEPVLLEKKLINITQKGRSILDDSI